jgi:signal transduction histidine kinase
VALDGMAAAGFALLPQVSLLRTGPGPSDGAVVLLLSVAASLPIALRWRWPVPMFIVATAVACVAVLLGFGPAFLLAAAYALYAVAITQPRRRGVSAAVVGSISLVVVVGLMVGGTTDDHGSSRAIGTVLGVVVMGTTWAAGRAVREQREGTRRAMLQTAEQAKIAERLRIAREMHDVVTHSLGLIAIQAGVANHVLASRPDEVRKALVVIESVSHKALREMRAMLGVVRTEQRGGEDLRPVPGLAEVSELVETAEAAGIRVELALRQEDEVPDGVAMSAYRIVQEALTNVVRHVGPNRCQVSVVAETGTVAIRVADAGPRPAHRPTPSESGGLGLIGIRERVAAHEGSVTIGPGADGGFVVAASLRY